MGIKIVMLFFNRLQKLLKTNSNILNWKKFQTVFNFPWAPFMGAAKRSQFEQFTQRFPSNSPRKQISSPFSLFSLLFSSLLSSFSFFSPPFFFFFLSFPLLFKLISFPFQTSCMFSLQFQMRVTQRL